MMLGPLVAAIDKELDDRTDEQPKSAYLSGKDLKWLAAGVMVLFALLTPIYCSMKRQAESHLCVRNLQDIFKATQLYSDEHDGKLPPAYVEGGVNLENGAAITWVTSIGPYMGTRASFECPSALPAENVLNVAELFNRKTNESEVVQLYSSYGIYTAYSTYVQQMVDRPGQTVLYTETSNRGARKTFDPLPLPTTTGEVSPWDGFAVGWDTSNLYPEPDTELVTRLAFPGTGDGTFSETAMTRHPSGNHFMFVDGHLETLDAVAARVKMSGGFPSGLWTIPPTLGPASR